MCEFCTAHQSLTELSEAFNETYRFLAAMDVGGFAVQFIWILTVEMVSKPITFNNFICLRYVLRFFIYQMAIKNLHYFIRVDENRIQQVYHWSLWQCIFFLLQMCVKFNLNQPTKQGIRIKGQFLKKNKTVGRRTDFLNFHNQILFCSSSW